ncbi:MAG: hypothetical protein KTR15_09245 [Phycisphaeraceae bacterium]|nr:hypothetical protein [Phycisphaeraceae bacterium]
MNDQRRQAVLIGVMLGMLCVTAGWSTLRMLGERRAAVNAAQDLQTCERLVDEIDRLQDRDAVASSQGDTAYQEQQLAERINEAASKATLSGNWQQGIEHRREVRIDDTPYLRKPAVLVTRGLTLHQLALLLHHLTYDSPYTADHLQLRTPPGEQAGGRWDADVTLSYLIYSPQATALAD